jgi:hypothetical protein
MGIPIDAHAAPVTWTLDNVVFDDGATATGSFVYDRDTNTYSAISITTDPQYEGCNADYIVENADPPNLPNRLLSYDRPVSEDMSDACSLGLWFVFPALTNDGGVVDLYVLEGPMNGSREQACGDPSCSNASYLRDIVSGSVIGTVTDSDSDGDGIPDDQDACPDEDATGFDADQDGCIDRLEGLSDVIDTLLAEDVVDETMATPLKQKVANAAKSATKENICAAVNQLEAFRNQIEAQRGEKLSDEAADLLTEYADNVTANLVGQLPPGEGC